MQPAMSKARGCIMPSVRLPYVLLSLMLAASAAATPATGRMVYDCSPGNGRCYAGRYVPGTGVVGRQEGSPSAGPNLIVGPRRDKWGEWIDTYMSDDTDLAYDLLGAVQQWYLARFGLNGANNRGGTGDGRFIAPGVTAAYTYANWWRWAAAPCPNAYFFINQFSFCTGSVSRESVGHEYQHAVQRYLVRGADGQPAGFDYAKESGALAEGYADLFGEAFEAEARGAPDWFRRETTHPYDLRDPEAWGRPADVFSQQYACQPIRNDFGGVHQNSSVLAHAGYLIATGGTTAAGCEVAGVGLDTTLAVFYGALKSCLRPDSDFKAAYDCLLMSCAVQFPGSACMDVARTLQAAGMDQTRTRCSAEQAGSFDCGSVDCAARPWANPAAACACAETRAGVPDEQAPACVRAYVRGLRPPPPRVSVSHASIRLSLTWAAGLRYRVTARLKRAGVGGGRLRRFESRQPVFTIPATAAIAAVRYAYMLGGRSVTVSRSSRWRKVPSSRFRF